MRLAKFYGWLVLAGMVMTPAAQALTYVGELRTPYVINVTVDPKAASLPEAKVYLDKATKLIGTNF
jgi:hypothetical protein